MKTEKIQFWVQINKTEAQDAYEIWKDIWKFDTLEEAKSNLLGLKFEYPDCNYRLMKREIVEEIF